MRAAAECDGTIKKDSVFDCSGNGELLIYPNPGPGTFTIRVSSDVQEEVSIVVVNMLGQKLKIAATLTNTPLTMDLNDEPSGVYIVTMYSAHGKCSKKVKIER